ncbi:MAG: PfkB family carbohydrate kinase [Actinomycetia bacterium]|nr:PfkB family carbohydrate kinase [Actinomycetes bacterium]
MAETPDPLLLIVGEVIVLTQRDCSADPPTTRAPDPSGAPAISAYIAARLGVPTAFVGGIGEDGPGRLFRDRLDAAGVLPGTLAVRADLPTATAIADYFADGSRAFHFSVVGSAATAIAAEQLADLPERASWMHVSGSALVFGDPLAATVLAAAKRAKAAGATICVDPNIRAEAITPPALAQLHELVAMADYALPSEGELEYLGITEQSLLERGVVVVHTLGPDGCEVATPDGERTAIPAVHAGRTDLDTDGAGDTFAAAFVAATMAGARPVAAARFASEIVARAITVIGPMTVELSPDDLRAARS